MVLLCLNKFYLFSVCMDQMVYSVCVKLQKHLQPCCCLTLHMSQRTIYTCENTQPSFSCSKFLFFFFFFLYTTKYWLLHLYTVFYLPLSFFRETVVFEFSRNRLNGSSRLCFPYVATGVSGL